MLDWHPGQILGSNIDLRQVFEILLVRKPRASIDDIEDRSKPLAEVWHSLMEQPIIHQQAVAPRKIWEFLGFRSLAPVRSRVKLGRTVLFRKVDQRNYGGQCKRS